MSLSLLSLSFICRTGTSSSYISSMLRRQRSSEFHRIAFSYLSVSLSWLYRFLHL
jgi:hypothetical protein